MPAPVLRGRSLHLQPFHWTAAGLHTWMYGNSSKELSTDAGWPSSCPCNREGSVSARYLQVAVRIDASCASTAIMAVPNATGCSVHPLLKGCHLCSTHVKLSCAWQLTNYLTPISMCLATDKLSVARDKQDMIANVCHDVMMLHPQVRVPLNHVLG
jgi:hypothetical protein